MIPGLPLLPSFMQWPAHCLATAQPEPVGSPDQNKKLSKVQDSMGSVQTPAYKDGKGGSGFLSRLQKISTKKKPMNSGLTVLLNINSNIISIHTSHCHCEVQRLSQFSGCAAEARCLLLVPFHHYPTGDNPELNRCTSPEKTGVKLVKRTSSRRSETVKDSR